ncbi:MAG: glutaredoxin domain-containing protein [Dehalococcoidales bacterium]|jgi:glutaredoxin
MISVFTLPVCPNCDDLKEKLIKMDLQFETYNLEDADVRIDLLMKSVTLVEAPIVEINGRYMSGKEALVELNILE